MRTTKEVMEACYESELPYEDVVIECQKYHLPTPTSLEYQILCEFNNDAIRDWKIDLDGRYDTFDDEGIYDRKYSEDE